LQHFEDRYRLMDSLHNLLRDINLCLRIVELGNLRNGSNRSMLDECDDEDGQECDIDGYNQGRTYLGMYT
jgi:hypothetical protein